MKKMDSTKIVKVFDDHFHDVMEEIGWFGNFTIRLYIFMYLSIIYGAMNIIGSVFLEANVAHHCKVPHQIINHVEKVGLLA